MTIRLGVSGSVGSFTEAAALDYATRSKINYELVYFDDIEKLLLALDDKEIDTGVFAVHNHRGGVIPQAFSAMGNHLFTYLTSFSMHIEQCLMTKSNIALTEITAVASHPQGLVQSTKFINTHLPNVSIIETKDTAKAARDLAQGRYEDTVAVIAPGPCAKLFGLHLKQSGVQDLTENLTTFVVVT